MGIRSKVAKLPASVRAELDRRIAEGAFSGYQAIAEWLQAQGYQIADDTRRNAVKPSKRLCEVRIRNVPRYGARLWRQLDAINLAHEQAKAVATAAQGAGDSADSLTAIPVQLIQQQMLSILLQTAHPASSGQPETADGEAKTLDLRDLQRLTRIIVHLNRVTHPRAGQGRSPARQAAADKASAQPMQKGLSEEAYHAIRSVLLERHPVEAYSGDYPPDQIDTTPAHPVAAPAELPETPPESAETPAKLNTSSAQPAEVPPEPIPPAAANAAAAEAHPGSSEVTQPGLTAAPRIFPHNQIYRVPLDQVTN
jgi:Protein of unknown function (DUF3486)